jgi:hypothetical protein
VNRSPAAPNRTHRIRFETAREAQRVPLQSAPTTDTHNISRSITIVNGRVRVSQARQRVETEPTGAIDIRGGSPTVLVRQGVDVAHRDMKGTLTATRCPQTTGFVHCKSARQARPASFTHRSARCLSRGFNSVFEAGGDCRRFISAGAALVRLEPCVHSHRPSLSFTSPRGSSCEFVGTLGSAARIRVFVSPVRTTVQQRASQLQSGR